MKCREFHGRLADWVRGNLTGEADEHMTRHAAACRSCAEEADLERSLRQGFRMIAPIERTPDLWERIEARVETAQRPRFAFRFQRMFALGGALAAGVLMAVMALPRPGVTPAPHGDPSAMVQADKPGVLEMINEIRVREADPAGSWSDKPWSESPYGGDGTRVLLVGGTDH